MKTFEVPSRSLGPEDDALDYLALGSSEPGAGSAFAARRTRAGETLPPRTDNLRALLAARWARLRPARVRAAAPGAPSPMLRAARRWSPGVVPPLVGGALLAGAVFIATRHAAQQPSSLAPETLLKLVVAYLLCGALYGVLLHLAASDLVWICVLALGAAVYLVATAGMLGGPSAAIVLIVAVGALGVWYVRANGQIVPDGRVLVTGIAGGYARTLYPGRAVLAPFERTLALLDTTEQRFACPTQSADVPNELGEVFVARAAATAVYSLIPSEAHHALALGAQWERDLRELIPQSLRVALGEWGAHILMGDEAPPQKLLARTLLRELREQVRPYGIHVVSIAVRDIWLVPEEELPALDAAAYAEATRAAERADSQEGRRSLAAAVPLASLRHDASPSLPVAAVAAAGASAPVATSTEPAEALSADVLSDAYEAVREGRINDPATIRQVAQAFLRVADDPALNVTFPYDATAAARILLERALSVEHGR